MKKENNFDMGNRVVESNDLIDTVWKMKATTLKLFEMAVSCIDVKNPPKDNIIYLAKTDIFDMFNVKDSDQNRWSRFKEHFKNLMQEVIVLPITNKPGRWEMMTPIHTVRFGTDENDRLVEVHFNPNIMPYLIDLKQNFSQYEIGNLRRMNSKYSILLYKLAKMNIGRNGSNEFTYTMNEIGRAHV